MTTKRWVAIIVASVLVFVSIGINTLSYIFTRDVSGLFEEFTASSAGYGQLVIEEGGRDQIAVLYGWLQSPILYESIIRNQ